MIRYAANNASLTAKGSLVAWAVGQNPVAGKAANLGPEAKMVFDPYGALKGRRPPCWSWSGRGCGPWTWARPPR